VTPRLTALVVAFAVLAVGLLAPSPASGVGRSMLPTTGQDQPPGTSPEEGPVPGSVPAWLPISGETPRDAAVRECLVDDRRPADVVDGDSTKQWPGGLGYELPHDTAIDARSRTFDDSELNEDGFGTGVKFHESDDSRDRLCFVGGTVTSDFDPEQTSWNTWHRVTGMTVLTPGYRLVGTRFFNQGDMVAFGFDASGWEVIGVGADGGDTHAGAYLHDDCVENDGMGAGLIDDVKLDGCHVFLSSSSDGTRAAPGAEVEVRRSLVRLQPYDQSFNPPKYGNGQHGGFFKWAYLSGAGGVPPALVVTDSMFRAHQPAPYGGNENGGLGLPPGTTCSNVILVGTESWPAKDLSSWRDQCTDLTFGTVADWDAATAAWDAAHPPLRDLPGQAVAGVGRALAW